MPTKTALVPATVRRSWPTPGSIALADELKAAAERGEPDDGTCYYNHWVAALERLVTEKGLTESQVLEERKDAWATAYRYTPHGQPVVLRDRQGFAE